VQVSLDSAARVGSNWSGGEKTDINNLQTEKDRGCEFCLQPARHTLDRHREGLRPCPKSPHASVYIFSSSSGKVPGAQGSFENLLTLRGPQTN
jgi:hypothetical protein